MLGKVLQAINNYFVRDYCDLTEIKEDRVIVQDPTKFSKKQYILVLGSKMNDGVYRVNSISSNDLILDSTYQMIEETTDGMVVCGLAIPRAILDLTVEIETYNSTNPGNVKSESLGDYSVTYNGNEDASWITVFRKRLAEYKKPYLNLPYKTRSYHDRWD